MVLHPDRTLPLVTVNLWYHVGSKNERPGRTGFAHLFEHMLFQGSEHIPANGHFRHVQQVGGVANGSTWYDRTNYFETLPAQHLELGLWLESDRMGYLLPAITQQKLDNQREVVMNERRQRVDNQPYGRASERLFEILYPGDHPYHWPVIGYMDDLAGATLRDVREFWRTYYVPNNAVLTLAGDFEPESAMGMVSRYFEAIPSGPEVPDLEAGIPPAAGEKREVLEDSVQLPRVYIAYSAPRYGDSQWYAANLLSSVLTGGKSSILYEDLVYRRQMAHNLGSFVTTTEACSTFVLIANGKPGVDPSLLENALVEHLSHLSEEPPPEVELERAKNALLTAHHSELQTLDRRADLLSQFTTFFNDPGRLACTTQSYNRLRGEDLRRFVQDFCGRDRRVCVVVLPREPNP